MGFRPTNSIKRPDFFFTANIATQVAQSAGDFRVDIVPTVSILSVNQVAMIQRFQQYRVRKVTVTFQNCLSVNTYPAINKQYLQIVYDVPLFN